MVERAAGGAAAGRAADAEVAAAGVHAVFAGRSSVGNVRERNEDRLGWAMLGGARTITPPDESIIEQASAASDRAMVFTVADGLGAYGGGDTAAGLAVETCIAHALGDGSAAERIPGRLRTAYTRANQAIFDAAIGGMAGGRKMQSTLTTLALAPGEAFIGHVGDCRVYRLRGGAIEILTSDHSQVMELLRMRIISPEQALTHPARYALTRSLGGDISVRADIRTERLLPGDTFLLCSDGLWSNVAAAEIRDSLALEPRDACDRLVELALANGGDDNATAMTIQVASAGTKPEARTGWRRLFS